MSSVKKRLKQLAKRSRQDELERKRIFQELRRDCKHVNKKGHTLIEKLDGDPEDVKRGVCSKCGEVLILDPALLTKESVELSVQVIKTVMAEARVLDYQGAVKLDKTTKKQLETIDTQLLVELPELMAVKKKKKKDKKEKKRKANQYQAWAAKSKGKKKKKKNKRKSW